jgi:hypothetical protein
MRDLVNCLFVIRARKHYIALVNIGVTRVIEYEHTRKFGNSIEINCLFVIKVSRLPLDRRTQKRIEE